MNRATRGFSLALLLALAPPVYAERDETTPPAPAESEGSASAAEATPDGVSDFDASVITVWGERPILLDVIQGSRVVEGDRLERDLSPTLGQTLESVTGVHNSGFGPGAGRPVIRAFDGNRIRVLQNGIGTLDASTASPDHNVAVEPLTTERIEVLRGAGTLRYGTTAIGGVVNAIDGRIPAALPDGGIDFALRSGYGSNADERFVGGGATVGWGSLAFHGEGFLRSSDDLEINGLNVSKRRRDQIEAAGGDVEAFRHVVPGTDIDENRGGSLGVSLIADDGFAGIAYSRLRNNYGIVDAAGVADPAEPGPGESDDVRIDLEQTRVDVAGEWRGAWLLFDELSFRGAYSDYTHDELEGGTVGTTFATYAWEGRVEARQQPVPVGREALTGLWGVQFQTGSQRAVGEEAFVPRTDSLHTGLFSIQELAMGPFDFELGLRWDYTNHDPRESTGALTELGVPDPDEERFHTLSVSAGGSWSPNDTYLVGISLARTERAPSVEELFSGGPHLATGGFELGDPSLHPETGVGLEITARKQIGRVTGGVNAFYTTFDDYIYQRSTGAVVDDLPVRRFDQADAEMWGAELELEALAYERGALRGLFDVSADFVRAELQSGDPLPRIAPWRVRVGAVIESRYADLRLEGVYVGEQRHTARFELPTDDYALFNASLVLRPVPDRHDLQISIEGRNLGNREARNHVSFLKDVLPLPGRDVRISLRYQF